MTKSQELTLLIKKKSEAVAKIIYNVTDAGTEVKSSLTSDEQAQLKVLEGEIGTLQGQIDEAKSLEQLAQKNSERLAEINQAANRIPMPDVSKLEEKAAINKQVGVEYEGSEYAGSSYLVKQRQLDALAVAYEDGHLGIDLKTRSAISTLDYKRCFNAYMRKGKEGLSHMELKTLQEGIDSQGGFLVPDDVANFILQKLPTPTRIAGMVQVLNTSRDHLQIPRVVYSTDDKYTTGVRSTWTGETPSSSTVHRVTDPVFGQLRIPVHTNMMSLPITNDMVEDSQFPLIPWCAGKFNETMELLTDDMILNGTGLGQPMGILADPGGTDQPAVVVSGSAALVTADGIKNLSWSLPEQYEPNSKFVLNKTNTGKTIATLKDTTNRYLFGFGHQDDGLAAGRPTTLDGYPYVFSGFMPNQAANAYPIIFGDLRGYILLKRVGFSIQVLREIYAETNQIVLLGRTRFGGQVAEPYRLKIQKCST